MIATVNGLVLILDTGAIAEIDIRLNEQTGQRINGVQALMRNIMIGVETQSGVNMSKTLFALSELRIYFRIPPLQGQL